MALVSDTLLGFYRPLIIEGLLNVFIQLLVEMDFAANLKKENQMTKRGLGKREIQKADRRWEAPQPEPEKPKAKKAKKAKKK